MIKLPLRKWFSFLCNFRTLANKVLKGEGLNQGAKNGEKKRTDIQASDLLHPRFSRRMSTKSTRAPIEFEIGVRIEFCIFPLGQKKVNTKKRRWRCFFFDGSREI